MRETGFFFSISILTVYVFLFCLLTFSHSLFTLAAGLRDFAVTTLFGYDRSLLCTCSLLLKKPLGRTAVIAVAAVLLPFKCL